MTSKLGNKVVVSWCLSNFCPEILKDIKWSNLKILLHRRWSPWAKHSVISKLCAVGWSPDIAPSVKSLQHLQKATTWLVVSNIFYFHPYLGKWSNLTTIFQVGCNHQLATVSFNLQPGSKKILEDWHLSTTTETTRSASNSSGGPKNSVVKLKNMFIWMFRPSFTLGKIMIQFDEQAYCLQMGVETQPPTSKARFLCFWRK